jgi:hypothetical protein
MRTALPLLLPPSCAVVMKSGNLNFLEPSGPLQACNGTALPLYILFIIVIGGILVLFVYITRLASNEIFSPSNKIHQEVGRAKDLSSPLQIGENVP